MPFAAPGFSVNLNPHSILLPRLEQKTLPAALRKPLISTAFFSFSRAQALENSIGVPGSGWVHAAAKQQAARPGHVM